MDLITDKVVKKVNGQWSFRFYMYNPVTKKKEQISKKHKYWTREQAIAEYWSIIQQGPKYFLQEQTTEAKKKRKFEPMQQIVDVFEDYIEEKAGTYKPSYIEAIKITYNAYIHDTFGHLRFIEVNQDMIREWKIDLANTVSKYSRTETLTKRTRNRIITVLRNLLEYSNERDAGKPGVFELPKLFITPEKHSANDRTKKIAYWKRKDWDKFLEMIPEDNYHDKAMFMLMLYTSIRASECRSIKEADFDLEDNELTISINLGRRPEGKFTPTWIETPTKGMEERHLFLDESVMVYVRKLIEDRRGWFDYNPKKTYLFTADGEHPISINAMRYRFNKYKKAMALKYPNVTTDTTLHGLRHSAITYAAINLSLEQAMYVAGHASAETTSGYVHSGMSKDSAKKIAEGYIKKE